MLVGALALSLAIGQLTWGLPTQASAADAGANAPVRVVAPVVETPDPAEPAGPVQTETVATPVEVVVPADVVDTSGRVVTIVVPGAPAAPAAPSSPFGPNCRQTTTGSTPSTGGGSTT